MREIVINDAVLADPGVIEARIKVKKAELESTEAEQAFKQARFLLDEAKRELRQAILDANPKP